MTTQLISFIIVCNCLLFTTASAQQESLLPVQSFTSIPSIHIRALEVLNDSTAWFGASRGAWGYTEDGGNNWHIDSIKVDSVYPEFRSMAILNDSSVLLLGIGSPACMVKTDNKGKTWRTVYNNTHKEIFLTACCLRMPKMALPSGIP